jgi:hypothetical protein
VEAASNVKERTLFPIDKLHNLVRFITNDFLINDAFLSIIKIAMVRRGLKFVIDDKYAFVGIL